MPRAVGHCDRASQSGAAQAAIGCTCSLWGSAMLAFGRFHRLDFFSVCLLFFMKKERKEEAGEAKINLTGHVQVCKNELVVDRRT